MGRRRGPPAGALWQKGTQASFAQARQIQGAGEHRFPVTCFSNANPVGQRCGNRYNGSGGRGGSPSEGHHDTLTEQRAMARRRGTWGQLSDGHASAASERFGSLPSPTSDRPWAGDPQLAAGIGFRQVTHGHWATAATPSSSAKGVRDMERHALRTLRRWTDTATVGLYVVILLGFLDTFTLSAEGCGAEWPLCDGGVTPGPGLKSAVEYGHRAVTGLVAVLVVVVVVSAWRRFSQPRQVRWFGAIGLGFVAIQSALGAAAVLHPESAPILALHFGFSLLALGGIALMDVTLRQLERSQTGWTFRQRDIAPALRRYIWLVLAYTMALIYWGTYVSHRGAGTACQGWPLCNGQVWPGFHGLETLIFIHRLGALMEALLVTVLAWAVRRGSRQRPDMTRAAHGTLILVGMQIVSGAYLILSNLSLPAEILHVAIVTVLFIMLSYLAIQSLHNEPLPHAELQTSVE